MEGFTVRLFLATPRCIILYILFIYFNRIYISTDEHLVISNYITEDGRKTEICRRRWLISVFVIHECEPCWLYKLVKVFILFKYLTKLNWDLLSISIVARLRNGRPGFALRWKQIIFYSQFFYMGPGKNPACLIGNFDSFSRGKVAETWGWPPPSSVLQNCLKPISPFPLNHKKKAIPLHAWSSP